MIQLNPPPSVWAKSTASGSKDQSDPSFSTAERLGKEHGVKLDEANADVARRDGGEEERRRKSIVGCGGKMEC